MEVFTGLLDFDTVLVAKYDSIQCSVRPGYVEAKGKPVVTRRRLVSKVYETHSVELPNESDLQIFSKNGTCS